MVKETDREKGRKTHMYRQALFVKQMVRHTVTQRETIKRLTDSHQRTNKKI